MRVRVSEVVLIVACVGSLVIYGSHTIESSPEGPSDRAGAELAEEVPGIDPWPYTVVVESDLSDARRIRVVVDIEAPEAISAGERAQIETMMVAAVDRHRLDWPDVVGVRLWASHGMDFQPVNGLDYSPDKCRWAGTDCSDGVWGTPVRGAVPQELRRWGDPSPAAAR